MIHVGIDPGISGAIAIISKTEELITVEAIHDMPVTTKTLASGKTRNRVDAVALHQILSQDHRITGRICIEDVCARPGEGATNAFTFGHVLGVTEAIARITGAEVQMVPPARWKAAYGLTSHKGESRHLAQSLTGDAETYRRAKDDGRAEAYLLAAWGASDGLVEHQGAMLDAYRATEAAKPKKARKGEAPTRTGEQILAGLKAKVAHL